MKRKRVLGLMVFCLLLIAFAAMTPRQADAAGEVRTQWDVESYAQLKEAVAYIDEVVSGLGEGEESPDFVITLKADITMEESKYVRGGSGITGDPYTHTETFISLPSATRLTMQSPAGSRYAITAYPLTIKYDKAYRDPTIRLFENSPEMLTLKNIDLKGTVDLVDVSADSHLIMKDVCCEIEKREDYCSGGAWRKGYEVSNGAFIACWGTAELENVDFIGDEKAPPQRGSGGLIGILGTSFSMKECAFENFLCAGSTSLVHYMIPEAGQPQQIAVKDCDFKNISFPYGFWGLVGGGAALGGAGRNATVLTVEGGSFTNCESLRHPAIGLYLTNATIKGVEFSGNKAVKQGDQETGDAAGAVRISHCDDFLLEDCTFTGNYSDLSGGAVQVWNSVGTIRGGEFKGNTAETHGGAICMLRTTSSNGSVLHECSLTTENTSFVGNVDNCSAETLSNNDHEAPGGGAIFLHMGCDLTLNEGTVIKGNQVRNKGNGGGVYASFGASVEVNGASILDNVADGNGGGLYMDGTDIFHGHELFNIPQGDFAMGSFLRFKDGIIAGNTAGNGGGVYLDGKNYVYEDLGGWGGTMQMDGGVITANHALNRGGGIYLQKGKDADSPAARFAMNNGAIYFNEAGTADKPPYNVDPDGAGAEIYNEGENTEMTVRTAEEITAYIQDASRKFVPEKDRNVWFMDWYEDFNATRDAKTRYMLTKVLDRAVYTPVTKDNANQALILDRSTALKVTKKEKNIVSNDTKYGFELKFTNLPPHDEALPVDITGADGSTVHEEIAPEGGAFAFALKAGESYTVSGLPAGAEFTLTEKEHGEANKLKAVFTNLEESALHDWTVTGKTRSTWQGSTEATKLSVVDLENSYEPPEKIKKSDTDTDDETTPGTDDETTPGPGDKATPGSDGKSTSKTVDTDKTAGTGDNTQMMLLIALFTLAALTAIAVLVRRRQIGR